MTSPEILETYRRLLIDAVTNKGPEKGLRGTNAREILGKEFNSGDFGYRNLRQFIQERVPELKIIGSSGGDVVWGLADWNPLPARTVSESKTDRQDSLWRTWVSPLSRRVIMVNLETSEIEGGPSDAPVEAGTIRIEPLDAQAHRDIAQAFLDTEHVKDSAVYGALIAAISDPNPDWWRRWNQALHADSHAFQLWHRYRVEQLRQKLHDHLATLNLPKGLSEKVEVTMADSSRPKLAEMKASTTFGRRPDIGRVPAAQSISSVNSLRTVVLEVIVRMSEEQLRGLMLPAGLLMDVLSLGIPNDKRSLDS